MFGIDRTPNICESGCMDTEELVIDAFRQLGIDARLLVGAANRGDLVVGVNGFDVELEVKRRSLVTDATANQLLDEIDDRTLMVVSDRVTESARQLLTSRGAGYLDLRGRLALRTGQVLIDAEVEPIKERAERVDALSGKAGLEVAVALLLNPEKERISSRRSPESSAGQPARSRRCSRRCVGKDSSTSATDRSEPTSSGRSRIDGRHRRPTSCSCLTRATRVRRPCAWVWTTRSAGRRSGRCRHLVTGRPWWRARASWSSSTSQMRPLFGGR